MFRSILRTFVGNKVGKVDTLLHFYYSTFFLIRLTWYTFSCQVFTSKGTAFPGKYEFSLRQSSHKNYGSSLSDIYKYRWANLRYPWTINPVNNIIPEVSWGNSINGNFDLNPSSYIEANAQYCSCIVVTESTGWHKSYFSSHDSLYILLWFSPYHLPLLVVLLRISITINSTCTCTS